MMLLRLLFWQPILSLTFLQRCESQYYQYYNPPNYRSEIQNIANQPHQPGHRYHNDNNSPRFRGHPRDRDNSKDCRSGEVSKERPESRDHCVCTCDDCDPIREGCEKTCRECIEDSRNNPPGGQSGLGYDPYYPVAPHPRVVLVSYAIPMLIYTPYHTVISAKQITTPTKPVAVTPITSTSQSTNMTQSSPQTPKTTSTATEARNKTTTPTGRNAKKLKAKTTAKLLPTIEQPETVTSFEEEAPEMPEPLPLPDSPGNPDADQLSEIPDPGEPYQPLDPTDGSDPVEPEETQGTSENVESPATLPPHYFVYPDGFVNEPADAARCKDAANCFSRNWNKEGDPVKLYIEENSSIMPLVRLRPTMEKPVTYKLRRRVMATTPEQPRHSHLYKLKGLSDRFVERLVQDLRNKQVLVLQNQ